jgi:hypothetical protein
MRGILPNVDVQVLSRMNITGASPPLISLPQRGATVV